MKAFLFSVIYVAALGIAAHFVGTKLPRKWFYAEKFPYAVYSFEESGKLYRFLRVRKWKKRLPDMSRISKRMIPKRISKGVTSNDIDALVAETCVAEFVHAALSVLSLAILAFWRNKYGVIFVLIYIFVGNVPFIIIQRYNRPQLVRVSGKLKRRECRKLGESTGTVV